MRHLVVLCVGFFLYSAALFGMPLSPESVRQLRASGRLHEVAAREQAARERGYDAPGRNILPALRAIHRDDPNETIIHLPVILVDFADNPADQNNYNRAYYEQQFFSQGQMQDGSSSEWYQENSYGDIVLQGEVVGWVRAPQTYDYYVAGQNGQGAYPNNVHRLAMDVIDEVDQAIDFSNFDNDGDGEVETVAFVHAGPGAEAMGGDPDLIWSCAGNLGNNVVRVDNVSINGFFFAPEDCCIGVVCHESAHAYFGLPDLYDTDYSSNGLGMWSIMAAGSWGGDGARPVHFDAWCKLHIGILEPTTPLLDQNNLAIPAIEREPAIYKLWTRGHIAGQYFLVENRQQVGFDESLPASGLMIYHVDEGGGMGMSPENHEWYPGYENQGHYGIALEQADGQWGLEQGFSLGDEGDPYPGMTDNSTFNGRSTPNSHDYAGNQTSVAVENISFNGETAHCNMLVGRSLNDPCIAVNLEQLDFGDTPVNGETDLTLTVSNAGHARLNVRSVDIIGNDHALFSLVGGEEAFALDQGQSSDLVVRFSANSGGHKSATLRIASDDPYENPLDIRLTGNGITGPMIIEPSRQGIISDTTDEGTNFSIHFVAVDPNFQQLTWQIANRGNLPQAARFRDNGDGTADLGWQVGFYEARHYFPRFTVTNANNETDQITIAINVNNVNGPPILTHAIEDLGVDEDCGQVTLLYLDEFFNDPDGDRIIYTTSGAPPETGMTVEGDNTVVIQPEANYNIPRGTMITVHAADNLGRTTDGAFRLTINPINDPPGAFDLVAPADSASLNDYHLRFSWNAAPNPDADTIRYKLNLRIETTPPTLLTQPNIPGTSAQLTIVDSLLLAGLGVRNGGMATWWVEAEDGSLNQASNQQRTIRILPLGVGSDADAMPRDFAVSEGYPNPFNSSIRLDYALPRAAQVRIVAYTLSGTQAARLVERQETAGNHTTLWDGRDDLGRELPTGIYLIRVEMGSVGKVIKAALVR